VLSLSSPNTHSMISSTSLAKWSSISSSMDKWCRGMSVTGSGIAVLQQFLHSHPSEQYFPFFLQPHRSVPHPVLHLHPLIKAATFSGLSQSKDSLSPSITQPKSVRCFSSIVFLLACCHISTSKPVSSGGVKHLCLG